jgi:2-isopropylmalate synthase
MAAASEKSDGGEVFRQHELIHDWNAGWGPADGEARPKVGPKPIVLFDETLRDGIQSPSVVDPPLKDKLEILDLMSSVHIESADIGLPGASQRNFDDVLAMTKHIAQNKLGIQAGCAARTVVQDIAPVAEIQQRAGVPIELYTFIGSSPIRQLAEDWDLDHLLRTSTTAIDFAVKEGLKVCFVTEDTTRSAPETLDRMFRAAVEHGAAALVLCDTVGWATPTGTAKLIGWTQSLLAQIGSSVRVEWHGHNDRGLAVPNSLAAVAAGADRVHGCAMGMGERVGNAAIDLILLNLKLEGGIDWDLHDLVRYVHKAASACHFPIPRNYPLSGEDAFRTATGVHASAIIKAEAKGDRWLADRVYSGVPAGLFGREQVIDIGPMSGLSNVSHWLRRHGIAADEALARAVLQRAKESNRTLTDAEITAVIEGGKRADGAREGRT